MLALRNQTNLVLEQARKLQQLNSSPNGTDPLRYAFITSQADLVQQLVSVAPFATSTAETDLAAHVLKAVL